MKKLCVSLMAVLLVFFFVSFAAAQGTDIDKPIGPQKWVPGGMACQLFIPHYTVIGGWWSGLCLQNMSINANQYAIFFCDNDGYVTKQKDGAMTAYQKVVWMLTYAMTGSGEGWLVIESQYPLLGFVNFGNAESLSTLGPFWSVF
jgi:hypothetical protein